MQISSSKLTGSKTLLQRREYTSPGQLSMVRVTKYTAAQWCCRLHGAIQHSSEFDAIMATSAHLYTMPVPCQHNISRGNTLQMESLRIKHVTAEFSLPPCRLTTLQVCQACKNSLSPGQQDDCCQLICSSYAQTRPAYMPVSGALPGCLSATTSRTDLKQYTSIYFQEATAVTTQEKLARF